MPHSVLTRGRKMVARLTALAMVASIMVVGALPASAAPVDTSATCPSASIPSAGFVDIAAYSAAQQLAINCLADYEITQGTSATTYSPQMDVSRWQMALFLTRQAEVHGVALGDGSDQGFTDIAAYPAATRVAINQLAQLGVTTGTTATTYSPADPVTRWQMALFLTRLLNGAGFTLGDGSSQGFTDIAAYPASTQTAINQIAQAGVSEGFSATSFGPGQNTSRVQMASFLTRTLAADGVVKTGNYYYVVAAPNTTDNRVTYSTGSATAVYSYTNAQAKTLNGIAVSNAVYEANLAAWSATGTAGAVTSVNAIQIDPVTGDIKTNVNATSGLIGTVAATEFWIVDPATGVNIGEVWHGGATDFDFFMVDGAAATEAGYNANVSVGDTGSVTGGDGTTAAKARTISITNGTASGTVTAIGGGSYTIGVLTVPNPVDADSKTVDGVVVADAVDFLAELSLGDTATYARAGGVQTYTLTNAAPTPVMGYATGLKQPLVDAGLGADADSNFQLYVNATGNETVVLVDSGDTNTEDDATNEFTTYRVGGVVVTAAEFFAAITPGDVVSYQLADVPSNTASSISLTNVNGVSGAEALTIANPNLTFEIGDGGSTINVDYTATSALGLSASVGGVVLYQTNGVAKTEAQWEADVAGFITAPSVTPLVSLTKVGADLVWSVTS